MKHIRLFENFEGSVDPRLVSVLKDICVLVKHDYQGNTEHVSEYFGDGSGLLNMANTVRYKF